MLQLVKKPSERCPYCGGKSRARYAAGDWNQQSTEGKFAYRTCKDCSLIFIEDLPDDNRQYYIKEQYDIPDNIDNFDSRAASQAWKLELLKPHVAAGRMLEIGPATGEFATVARGAGFAPTLIEMDPRCCAFLRDVLRHEVIESDDPANALPAGEEFDVVCIWQAIEHIPNFWLLIEAAANRLRRGGVMVLSTPNPDSLQARLMGRYWPHADVPRHLYLISPRWFKAAARMWGVRVVSVTTCDEGSIGLNYYGWYLWVRNWVGRLVSPARVQALAVKLTGLFRRWECREGLGCSYVLILTKE